MDICGRLERKGDNIGRVMYLFLYMFIYVGVVVDMVIG